MTAYDMRISDWSSDVCSSDLQHDGHKTAGETAPGPAVGQNRKGKDQEGDKDGKKYEMHRFLAGREGCRGRTHAPQLCSFNPAAGRPRPALRQSAMPFCQHPGPLSSRGGNMGGPDTTLAIKISKSALAPQVETIDEIGRAND